MKMRKIARKVYDYMENEFTAIGGMSSIRINQKQLNEKS